MDKEEMSNSGFILSNVRIYWFSPLSVIGNGDAGNLGNITEQLVVKKNNEQINQW